MNGFPTPTEQTTTATVRKTIRQVLQLGSRAGLADVAERADGEGQPDNLRQLPKFLVPDLQILKSKTLRRRLTACEIRSHFLRNSSKAPDLAAVV